MTAHTFFPYCVGGEGDRASWRLKPVLMFIQTYSDRGRAAEGKGRRLGKSVEEHASLKVTCTSRPFVWP